MAPRLSLFLAELKRRKVYRVGAVYAAVGAAISIAIPDLFGAFGFPQWAAPLVIVMIVIGFPIALVLAWAYEVRPEEPAPAERDGEDATASVETQPLIETREERKSIAVLPFVDMSPTQDQEYFCDGMAEELINALTKVGGLRVAARTSSFYFKGKAEDIREVGRQLAVGTVLEGSVRRIGHRLRVTAQLVSAEDGYHLWSESYDRELRDVFAIQDEISRSIVETLRPTLIGSGGSRLVAAPTSSLEAYDLYLEGRHYWEGRYEKGLMTALRYFERAVEIDPEYALPHTGIADSYTVLGLYGFLRPEEARQRARVAAERAVEIDQGLSEAHASFGFYHLFLGFDWQRSVEAFSKAIELNPDHAKAHAWLGFTLGVQGRFDEAFNEFSIAQRLDPLSNYITTLTGAACVHARDFARASGLFEQVVKSDPNYLFAVWMSSWVYSLVSKHDDAIETAQQAVALSDDAPHFKSWLGAVYGAAGMEEKARAIIAELHARKGSQYVSPLWLAWIHSKLGEEDVALTLLERAVAEQAPFLFIHQDPNYDPLRSNSRFASLMSQVGTGVVGSSYDSSLNSAEPS